MNGAVMTISENKEKSMYTVKISKQKDFWSAAVYENGVFTGKGGVFSNANAAKEFEQKVKDGLFDAKKEDVEPEKTAPEEPDAEEQAVREEDGGQLSFEL